MRRRGHVVALAAGALACAAAPAAAEPEVRELEVRTSDGTALGATLRGAAPLAARPVVVEFSPYGRDSGTFEPGPAYNRLVVQIRGTGGSDGAFDALGPRTQADVVEVLRWACDQPWSDGRLALNGFSASAITVYNSLHHQLPCVKAALLKSGTFELYRDLLTPGGITNLVPAVGVLGLIGGAALAQAPDRVQGDPVAGLQAAVSIPGAGVTGLQHPTLDGWWRERGFRGDVNDLPILMIDGFFDVESRGAFEGYQALRDAGAHLIVVGAHDGVPRGTDGGVTRMRAWLDRYVRGIDNGVEHTARVQALLTDGARETYLAGRFERLEATDWPVPGTRWRSLAFDATRSGSGARSINDGSLRLGRPATTTQQTYPSLPSPFTSSDPPNAAIVGAAGLDAVTAPFPFLGEMTMSEPFALSYTTTPLREDVVSAGPASVELRLSSTAGRTGVWAVLSDVGPDGKAHPLTAGRLDSAYPDIVASQSRRDPVSGEIVQPYGRFDAPSPPAPGQERLYRIELWPVGNRFRAGHRVRVDIVGASIASMPSVPALNTIRVGGPEGSRLLLPVLPGSDACAALGGEPCAVARRRGVRLRLARGRR